MPGGTVAGNASSKYITAALADLFSCVGAGDIVSAKALLESKHKNDKDLILSATNPAGITLLQHACHSGQAGGVKMLLEEGADPSWTSTKGSTPLHFACNNGHFDCAEALLTAGVDVDARNANGTTPLIIAAFGAHTSCVRLLLEHDADPNVRDNLGRRAGDSLCGAVTGLRGGAGAASSRLGTNGAGTPSAGGGGGSSSSANPENEPFSETRSLLAVARAQRSSRKSRSDSAASATASAKTSVHIKRLDAVDGGHASAFRAGGGMTLGAAADVASDERGGRAEVSRGGSTGSMPPPAAHSSPTLSPQCPGGGHTPGAKTGSGSTSTSRTNSMSRSSSSSSTSNSGGGHGCIGANHATNQGAQPSSQTHGTAPCLAPAPSAVPSAATRPEQQQAAGGRVSGGVSPLEARSPMTSPGGSRRSLSRTATPMASPAPSPMASPSRGSKSSSSPSASSQPPSSNTTSASQSSSSGPTIPGATAAAATAAMDPELDHPHLQSQRTADLKAALAANAAMIRSMQEEERVFSAQRDLLERRRGEAGERRKGAEEHAALLRARAGAMCREETAGTPLTLTPVATAPAAAPAEASAAPAAAASGSSTPTSRHGEGSSGKSSDQPPVFMLPSPVSKSNTNVSVFNISTRTTSNNAGGGSSGGGGDGVRPSTFSSVSARPADAGEPPESAAMAVADSASVPTTSTSWRRNMSVPPVPDFTMTPPGSGDENRRHAARSAAPVAAAGVDGGSAGVMEDEDDRHRGNNNDHRHEHQPRQQRSSPGRRVNAAPSSSRSPFRRSSASRGHLELRLQSPLRTLHRDAGDSGDGRVGSGLLGFGRTSSASSSSPNPANDHRRQHEEHQRHGALEEPNADMVEADQESGEARRLLQANPLIGARSEAHERVGSGSDASTAEALEAQSRRVQELEAELRATRRDNRYRDGRSQRTRTNANKRQRAGTSFSSQHSRHSHHHHSDADGEGARGGDKSCFSPRGATHESPSSSASSSFSDLEPMSPALRNEVRRLRAESAARGREHASLAAQHASLVLEKARQAGVLRNRVASADEEVERLSRKLREAQEKLEAQAQEAEALRRQAEEQQGLLHSRSHVLEQALGRLENIGVALAEERSLNSASRRHSLNGNLLSADRNNANGGGASGRSGASAEATGGSSGGSIGMSNSGSSADQHDDMASVEPETAPSMSVDGVSQAGGDDNESDQNDHDESDNDNDNDNDESDVVALEDAPVSGGGGRNSGNSGSDGAAAVGRRDSSAANADGQEGDYEEDGAEESVPMRDVEGEENEASEGPAASSTAPITGNPGSAAAGGTREARPYSGHEMARIFSHQQIDAACAGFPDSAIVGRGGFGPVFRGHFMGEEVAVKRLDGYGLQGLPNFLREVQVLTTCRHEHLVPLLGICVDPTPMLVYPFVGQSLEWHLREPQRRAAISWTTRLAVALSVSKGLQYLHQPQAGAWGKPVIVHRDVKTENILMDSNLRARLSDVGIARQLDRGGSEASTRLIGTWGYIDPEYQETGVLTPSSDVYSLGVVFLELLTGLPAHSAQLRPPSLVDRVIGKQLSDCLDSACTWPDTPPVVAFATEAWQCVSRKGDDRPRLQHLIERLERLHVGEAAANDDASGATTTGGGNSNRDSNSGAAPGGHASSAILSPPASALGAAGGSAVAPSPAAASSAAMAAAAAAATAARLATEAAAAASAVASEASALMLESPPALSSSSASSSAASSPAMADAAAGGAVIPVTQSQPPSPPARRDCMICASAPVQTRFLPCRHSLACGACASLLRARGDRCPVDRARIDDFETGQFQVTYTGARETG